MYVLNKKTIKVIDRRFARNFLTFIFLNENTYNFKEQYFL